MTKSRIAEIKDKISADTYGVSKGEYIIRRGFFYRNGFTAEAFAQRVKEAFPEAVVTDSGEVWKPFRGGATTAQGSHWFVRFTLPAVK